MGRVDQAISFVSGEVIYIPHIWFTLSLTRAPAYYTINVVFMAGVLTAICLLMFALPVHAEEKVMLGVTLLLAYAVLSLLINDATPHSEHVPIISKYILINVSIFSKYALYN